MMPAENLQHPLQRLLQVERGRKRLTRFEQRRQLPDFAGVCFGRLRPIPNGVRHI